MQLKKMVETISYYLEPLLEIIKSKLSLSLKSRLFKSQGKNIDLARSYKIESRSRLIFWWRFNRLKTYSGDEVLQRFNRRRNRQKIVKSAIQIGVSILAVLFLLIYIQFPSFPNAVLGSSASSLANYFANLGIKIKSIEISGNQQLGSVEILESSGLNLEMPMLNFDGRQVREKLLTHPWVADAVVDRHLPSTVSIKVTEWKPVALWRKSNSPYSKESFVFVDSTGRSLANENSITAGNLSAGKYLRVVGNDANLVADSLRLMVKVESRLAERITRAEWVSGRRWNLVIDNRLLVKLPAEKAANSWSKLSELDTKYQICDRQIAVIDLRQTDRIIVTRGLSWLEAKSGRMNSIGGPETVGRAA